jgi:hypothetical protein
MVICYFFDAAKRLYILLDNSNQPVLTYSPNNNTIDGYGKN